MRKLKTTSCSLSAIGVRTGMDMVVEANQGTASNISDILDNMNWCYISLVNLLDAARSCALLRKNPAFRKIFTEELTRRYENSMPHLDL